MISKFIRSNIDTYMEKKNFAIKRAIYKFYRAIDSISQQEYVTGLELGIEYAKASIWKLENRQNDLLPLEEETIKKVRDLARCMADATMAIESTVEKLGFNDGMTFVIEAYKCLVDYEVMYRIGLLSEASRNKIIQP